MKELFMKLTYKNIFAITLALVTSSLSAATLNGEILVNADVPNNGYTMSYVLTNVNGSRIDDITITASNRLDNFNCNSVTGFGNTFTTTTDSLAAGDSILCEANINVPSDDISRLPIDIVTLGNDAEGERFLSKTSYNLLLSSFGGVAADEAIGTVLTGAVHNDNDADLLLSTNDTLSYSFTVVNTGSSVLNNIVVNDDIGSSISCPSNSLAVNSSFICTSSFTIPDNTTPNDFISLVTMTAVGVNGQSVLDEDAYVVLPVLFETASLNAAKVPAISNDVIADGFASVGDEITYSIIITNSNVDDIVIDALADPLPGLSAIVCDANTQNGTPFIGVGASLPAGDTIICRASVTVTTTDRSNGQINNNASVDGTSVLFAAVNINAAATVVVPTFQIIVEKVSTGLLDTFDFVLTNTDSANVSITTTALGVPAVSPTLFVEMLGNDVTITETLPMFFTLASVVCADAADTVIATTLVGETVTIDGADVGVVNPNTQSPITCTFTNDAAPDIDVAKTVVDANMDGVAEPGEQLDYSITLTNNGGVPITYAVGDIQETVPVNTTAVGGDDFDCLAADPAGTVCDTNTAITVPASDGVNPGIVTLTFSVITDDPLPIGATTISNSVIVPDECPNIGGSTNDCDEDTTAMVDELDLSIEKVSSQNFVTLGDTFTYTITVTNISLVVGEDSIVTDELPPQLLFISTEGCLNDPDGIPVCELGDIAPGETISYEITVELIGVPSGGLLVNIATVSSGGVDVDSTNNVDNAVIGVIVPVPVLHPIGLLILGLLLLLMTSLLINRGKVSSSSKM